MALTGTSASSVKARNRSHRFKRRQRCSSLGFTTTRSPNNAAAQTGSVGSDTCSILAPEGAGRPNYKPSSPEPLSAPGQTTFPAPPAPGQPSLLSGPSTFNMREETTRKANRHVARAKSPNHKSRGERARVLKFKARDQISQSRCCDCVKISSESLYCSLSPQDSESLANNFFSEAPFDHTKPVFTLLIRCT